MEKLLNCPFCGGDSVSVQSRVTAKVYNGCGRPICKKTFSCRCNKCHARGKTVTGWVEYFSAETNPPSWHEAYWEEQAIEAWNKREGEKK